MKLSIGKLFRLDYWLGQNPDCNRLDLFEFLVGLGDEDMSAEQYLAWQDDLISAIRVDRDRLIGQVVPKARAMRKVRRTIDRWYGKAS